MKYEFKANKSGVFLIEFLTDNIGGISLNKLKTLIDKGEAKVNGARVKNNVVLNFGDSVSIFVPSGFLSKNEIKIIYQDDNLVIVDKPILYDIENHLVAFFKKEHKEVYPVHRLDRNTTGLVILAFNTAAAESLEDAFRNRNIEKHYIALVKDNLKKDRAVLTAYIKKDAEKSLCAVSATVKDGYKEMITEYEVIKRENGNALIDVILHTGRTHQIRAHFAFLNCPIIGDGKYGRAEYNKGYPYQQLKAYKIKFNNFSGLLQYLNGKVFETDMSL